MVCSANFYKLSNYLKVLEIMSIKENDYLCPKCKGHLNTGGNVVFSTQNPRNAKGLILLLPNLGGYSHQHHKDYHLQKGDMIEFACPLCLTDLKSKNNSNFVSIIMIDHDNIEYEVLFSRKVGEKSTYVVAKDNIETFGEDALNFDDLFEY